MSDKLKIHFFNVNHGDSILIESISPNSGFVVIDVNCIKKDGEYVCPVFDYLRQRNVQKIDALIITHLHADHYFGVDKLINNFQIGKIVIPPVFSLNVPKRYKAQFENYCKKAKSVISLSGDDFLFKSSVSLLTLIDFINRNQSSVQEALGQENVFSVSGLKNLSMFFYLPFPKTKNNIYEKIENGNFELDQFPEMNDMSVAIMFKSGSKNIFFASDATNSQMMDHKNRFARDGKNCLSVNYLKASHHGSKENNTEKIYSYLFDETSEEKYVFVSANGNSHPHEELFELVEKFDLKPYCTNLSRHCAGLMNTTSTQPQVPKEAEVFLANYNYVIEGKYTPCQGDICLSLDNGNVEVTTSLATPCVYRFPAATQ